MFIDEKQEDEERREEALDGLAGAGSKRREGPERAEAERDENCEPEEDEYPQRPRLQPDADRQPDAQIDPRLHDAHGHHPAKLPG